ncbi:caspase-8 isoform X2 [Gadus morhua]|uniref:caspase-8 isoform X2 n=1 Tax=Gadus morhua TaxID=8049 RepID=UPI0011B7B609|nr:caspase-8-like isoform X2 [Gadus morhua]
MLSVSVKQSVCHINRVLLYTDRPEMEFRKKLLTVGMALSKDETEALAFLCTDILNRTVDPSSVESAVEFFDRLEAHGVLSEDHPFLLADLLDVIGRYRLLREFDLNCKRSTTRSLIPSYRKLLYQLSENITENDLKSIKFLLTKDLQRARLEPNVSTLEVFLALERKDLLSSSDLRLLEQILGQVCPVLLKDIQQFKATHGEQTPHLKGRIAQETGLDDLPPRSSSGISGHGTTTTSLLEGPPSEEIPASGHVEDPYLPQNLRLDLEQLSSLQLSDTQTVSSTETLSSSETNRAECHPQLPQAAEEDEEDQTVLAAYPMSGRERGFCWIVNNFDFSRSPGTQSKRMGTQIDEESLRHVFTWLGFQVEVVRDATRGQMLSSMRELASRDHSGMDCVACVVLSHGLEGGVYGVDGGVVSLEELQEPLNGRRCAYLRGKPKLFFIQACQGTQEQQAVPVQADGPGGHVDIFCDAGVQASERLTCREDFLTGMATVPSYVSLRHQKQGSWFIQSLCQNLVQMVPRGQDLVSILTKVNDDVSQMFDPTSSRRQMPQPAIFLRKRVVFPVPEGPLPSL